MKSKMKKGYILGLDLGSQSIGWTVCYCDEREQVTGLGDLGVRIFGDGRDDKSREPLAVGRRNAKQTARRRMRSVMRRRALIRYLQRIDLLPEDDRAKRGLAQLDPYHLRSAAVTRQIERYEIGRALLHINKRRGFKSNRKEFQSSDDEVVGMKKGIAVLERKLGKEMTLGQLLHKERSANLKNTVRFRPSTANGKNSWDIYPERSMYADEIRLILDTQREFYPDLDEKVFSKLHRIIIEQRPLKKPRVGSCRFYPDQDRAPLALPSSQAFRILQEVANLELRENGELRQLSDDERNSVVQQLLLKEDRKCLNSKGTEILFSKLKTKLLGDSSLRFNLEEMERKSLNVDLTAKALSSHVCFGSKWFELSREDQDVIVLKLVGAEDKPLQDSDDIVRKWLIEEWGLEAKQAEACLHAKLEDGYGRLGQRALNELLPHMENGLNYFEAKEAASLEEPNLHTEIREELPYYGEILENYTMPVQNASPSASVATCEAKFGRIPNPTVHVGLNQLRSVVNALIERFGVPSVVRIELARDFAFSAKQELELKNRQVSNKKRNDRARDAIAKAGQDPRSSDNLLRFKLWEELNASDPLQRLCPFSGRPISVETLFSSEVEIEHIIPFSRSFDDSFNNKTLSFRAENRLKLNRTPYEAYGQRDDYNEIRERASNLNPSKQWRFEPDAIDRFIGEHGSLIARTLNDTRYFSRLATQYLRAVCPKVESIRGAMTASLRRQWGLENVFDDSGKKDRSEHRHHAIDAFVVACSTRSFLHKFQQATEAMKREFPEKNPLHIPSFPEPFDGYHPGVVQAKAVKIIVSHKQDRRRPLGGVDATPGELHEKTFFGLESDVGNESVVKVRKPLADLKRKDCAKIASPRLRSYFEQQAMIHASDKEWKDFLHSILGTGRIRRLRMLEKANKNSFVRFKARDGSTYRLAKTRANAWVDVFEVLNKSGKAIWKMEVTSLYQAANETSSQPPWKKEYPTARKIARLSINDSVALCGEDGFWRLFRVKKMSKGKLFVRDLRVAHEEGDSLSLQLSATKMQNMKLAKVAILPDGKLMAPKHIRENLYVGSIYSDTK